MPTLYQDLSDYYDRHSSDLIDYRDSTLTLFTDIPHYNLRSYWTTDVTLPWTMNDMHFWNAYHFSGMTIDTFNKRRYISGRTYRRRLIDELSIAVDGGGSDTTYFSMTQLNGMTMYNIDFVITSLGNEEWPSADPDVVVGKDSAYRYANTLKVTLHNGVAKTVSSYYNDDIYTDFQNPSLTYYIEVALPSFPASSLNLSQCFIDISSSLSFDSSVTDSLKFSNSLNNVSGGGNTFLRFPVTALVNSDPSNLKALRLRLLSTADVTVTFREMRLVASIYPFPQMAIDTKKAILRRASPEAGAPEASSVYGNIFFEETQPKNGTVFVKFNSGHNPTGNDNVLRVLLRHQPDGDHISVRLFARDTQSRLRIYETVNGVETEIFSTGTLANILTNETTYYLKIDFRDQQVQATIYNEQGLYTGTQVYSTGWQNLSTIGRGYVGYSFEPYNYDFFLSFVHTLDAEFALYESTPFRSTTPVKGATILTLNSQAIDLASDFTFETSGDSTLTTESIANINNATKVVRDGTQWYGGIKWIGSVVPSHHLMLVTGNIFPVALDGQYRVVVVNENLAVGYIGYILNLKANQWNAFSVPINLVAVPDHLGVYIHQIGYYPDTFYLDSLSVKHPTIEWYASPDAGITWYPFLDSVDGIYSGVYFNNLDRRLKIRAVAVSDKAWIEGYQVVPHYAYPGRLTI